MGMFSPSFQHPHHSHLGLPCLWTKSHCYKTLIWRIWGWLKEGTITRWPRFLFSAVEFSNTSPSQIAFPCLICCSLPPWKAQFYFLPVLWTNLSKLSIELQTSHRHLDLLIEISMDIYSMFWAAEILAFFVSWNWGSKCAPSSGLCRDLQLPWLFFSLSFLTFSWVGSIFQLPCLHNGAHTNWPCNCNSCRFECEELKESKSA